MNTDTPFTGLTLSGVDDGVDDYEIDDLLRDTRVEIGLLYSIDRAGSLRYPTLERIRRITQAHPGRCAIHICGTAARKELYERGDLRLVEALAAVQRVQINGVLDDAEIEHACDILPLHTVITQWGGGNVPQVDRDNHAILVDASAGRGIPPASWQVPAVSCRIGWAGGLTPENLVRQMVAIDATGVQDAWLDLETGLRAPDGRFSTQRAHQTQQVFASYARRPSNAA